MTDLLIAQLPEAGEYVHGWLGAAIGGLGSLASGIFGASKAKKEARRAAKERRKHEKKLAHLESTRQPVINPYADVENVSGLAENLTDQMSNPMDNLGVATQAAEFQAEQADIALANTLDTVRATGGGAGGATALAQAALQSKKGVSASIESQEANNEQLRAQGALDLEKRKVAEETRIQNVEISEAQRMQSADIAGKTFEYNEKEKRELAALDRVQAKIDGATAREMQANQDRTGAITGAIGGVAKGLSGVAAGGAFGSKFMGRTYAEQKESEG